MTRHPPHPIEQLAGAAVLAAGIALFCTLHAVSALLGAAEAGIHLFHPKGAKP